MKSGPRKHGSPERSRVRNEPIQPMCSARFPREVLTSIAGRARVLVRRARMSGAETYILDVRGSVCWFGANLSLLAR